MNNLNLYAKIEPMIGFYEEYLKELQNIEFSTLLDVGCGNGKFLKSTSLKLVKTVDINLFSDDEADKKIFIFKKI